MSTPIYDQLCTETGYHPPLLIERAMRDVAAAARGAGYPIRHVLMTLPSRMAIEPNVERRFAAACRREGLPVP